MFNNDSTRQLSETVSYLTDIITSYNGREQRLKIRQDPRYTYTYKYDAMNKYDAHWMKYLVRKNFSDIFYVPLWHKIIKLADNYIGSGALYIDNANMYNLYRCDTIEVFSKDDPLEKNYNIYRNVKRYADGVIGLNSRINKNLDKRNTWIFPLRPCYTDTGTSFSYVYHEGATAEITFKDAMDYPSVSIPDLVINYYQKSQYFNKYNFPEYYNNKNVFLFSPQWIDDNDQVLVVNNNMTVMDTTTGIIQYDMKNAKSYDTHNMKIYFMDIETISNMYRFFNRVCGRHKSFYMPTWVNDIEIEYDVKAEDKYIVSYFNIPTFLENSTRRKRIVIMTKDYKSYIFKIVGFEAFEDGDRTSYKIKLDGHKFVNLKKSEIEMCCFFNLVRLDSDDMTMEYCTDIAASTQLSFVEVDDDDIEEEEDNG